MPFTVETLPNCSLISLGRSIMLNRALKTDSNWTHVLWIDADLRFRPAFIHSMVLDDKDIVGGFYPKKGLPSDFASSQFIGHGRLVHVQEGVNRPPCNDVPGMDQVVDAGRIIGSHVFDHGLHRIAFPVIARVPVHQSIPTQCCDANVLKRVMVATSGR